MRCVVIILFCLVVMFNNCNARGIRMKYVSRNINNAINNACNKEAYILTSNSEMYNCLKVNTSQNCRHIENFTNYTNTKNICQDKNNSALGLGILLAIIGWLIISSLVQM